MKTPEDVLKQVKLIDIDGDGFVDLYDLDIFLKRNQYIDEGLNATPAHVKPGKLLIYIK